MQPVRDAMSEEFDDEDPKSPRLVAVAKKRTNAMEAREAVPWSQLRKDDDRDRHRHV
jgi:hypothetical protein